MSWETDEVRRVLYGLWLADLIDVQTRTAGHCAVVLETDTAMALQLREYAAAEPAPWNLKVVRDRLSLQLVLKRHRPDVMVVSVDSEAGCRAVEEILHWQTRELSQRRLGGSGQRGQPSPGELSLEWSARLARPYAASELFETFSTRVQQQEWRTGMCVGRTANPTHQVNRNAAGGTL